MTSQRPGSASASQLDLKLAMALHQLNAWIVDCPFRTTKMPCQPLQGGRAGMQAHVRTVHPEEAARAGVH